MTDDLIQLEASLPNEAAGQRLDKAVAELFPDYSRSRLQAWLKSGALKVDGEAAENRYKVVGGELVTLNAMPEVQTEAAAENLPLEIIYEDDHLIVINKQAGLVVHPGAGNSAGTLVNALLHHAPHLEQLPRAGLVHRLDKSTTGLLVISKTLPAHTALVAALQAREITREYETVVRGVVISGGTVDQPIDRSPRDRKKMMVREGGRNSITHYRVLERYKAHTRLRVMLETGRTHQIRVHMSHIKLPIVGDPVYGGRLLLPKGASDAVVGGLRGFRRQALHARRLSLAHPETGETMTWEAPLPDDMQLLIETLRADADHSA